MKMTSHLKALATAALVAVVASSGAQAAGGEALTVVRQPWTFSGFFGHFDNQQLQRGFQTYKEVCSSCHGLKRLAWRNLTEPGGPEFPVEGVKALAAEWPNRIPEMSEAGDMADKKGNILTRAPKLSDPILGPFANEAQARAANNGALPIDLSLAAKARTYEFHGSLPGHILQMSRDILGGYQEAGADYIYGLLTGYKEAPKGFKLADGMSYNAGFPGHQIAMPQPALGTAGYANKALATPEQQARDVTAFLAWAADPSLEQRKRIGWQVMLYLLITTVLLYLGKKRIWSKLH